MGVGRWVAWRCASRRGGVADGMDGSACAGPCAGRGLRVTTTSACTIPGCERPVRARGWCPMHYKRWRRHGDPLRDRTTRRSVCLIPGCEAPVKGRGWCSAHYQQWRVHGDPLHQRGSNRLTLACAECGKPFTASLSEKRRFCSRPCYITHIRNDTSRGTVAACDWCGESFVRKYHNGTRFCTPRCSASFVNLSRIVKPRYANCPVCGVSFPENRIGRSSRYSTHAMKIFCSSKCMAAIVHVLPIPVRIPYRDWSPEMIEIAKLTLALRKEFVTDGEQ